MLDKLIKFGFPEKEARVYLALLELGPSSVSEIAKRARIPRTNAYHLLNTLTTKGLVSTNEKSSKMVFMAEDPQRLVQLLKNQSEEFHRMQQEAKDLLPEFYSIYHKDDGKLKVRFFEGVEGLISAYEDTLTARDEILGYASVEYQHNFFPGYFPAYYTRRTKRGISVKCFLADSPESRRIQELDKAHLRETMLLPSRFSISPEINIYDNKMAIISLKEKFGAIIESKEVADAFKKMFELAFERSKQYNKEIHTEIAQAKSRPKNKTSGKKK
ncbi:MAG: helix-turn-helix domain-containing protein [Candidatus Gracilibacteria bacterium]